MSDRTMLWRGKTALTAALCSATLILSACGADDTPAPAAADTVASSAPASATAGQGEVTIADSWVKATAGEDDTSMTAAFGVLTNHTDKQITIISATNSVTDRTELHEMAMIDGAMVMRPIDGGIKIPANGSTTLEPGGLHVMIMDAKKAIGPGEDVSVTLTFDDGTALDFTAQAKEFAGANERYHGDDNGDDHDGSMSKRTHDSMEMGTGSSADASHG